MTTCSTPSGRCFQQISAILSTPSGASSAAFKTSVLPVHSAIVTFSAASITGAFQGTIPATTPSGSRTV